MTTELPGVPSGLAKNPKDRQPTNTNFLSPNSFRFFLHRVPTVTYFCQSVNIPSIELNAIEHENMFANIKEIGSKPTYGELSVKFAIDEDMSNWKEIHDWMQDISNFTNFNEYITPEHDHISDATLMVTTSGMNPNLEVIFKDCFPVALSSVEFDSTVTEIEAVTAEITLAFNSYSITSIS